MNSVHIIIPVVTEKLRYISDLTLILQKYLKNKQIWTPHISHVIKETFLSDLTTVLGVFWKIEITIYSYFPATMRHVIANSEDIP